MKKSGRTNLLILLLLGQAALLLPGTRADEVGYNHQIRPILSDNCFYCHGPDANKRKGKLRLDLREEAIAKKAIVPGKPEESELVARIFNDKPDDVMPPADSHKSLTKEQKDLLRQWVAEGARYEAHWAFIPPAKPTVPAGVNAIDHLVRKRLTALGLKPSPPAGARTLSRRLAFDLAGLPPLPSEVEAAEQATSPEWYRARVEKLLASAQFGERMAIGWLDVARFADTIGYHSDNPRNIWPYRDYVIRSFNENKPYDTFTREQIAGDLLPGATQEARVGSAFNRLLLTTEEGGAQPKDYEARMLTDRVRAVGTVWLGLTIGCAQCHDHKFDPIKAKDFYSMGAFFADIQEPIIGRREDGMLVPNEKQRVEFAALQEKASKLQKEFDAEHPELAEGFVAWQKELRENLEHDRQWNVLKAEKAESEGKARLETKSDGSILVKGDKPDKDTYRLRVVDAPNPIAALRIESIPDDSLPSKGAGRSGNGNFVLTEVVARLERANGDRLTLPFVSARADIEQTSHADKNPYKAWTAVSVIDGDAKGDSFGWAVLPEVNRAHQLVLELSQPVKLEKGDALTIEMRQNHGEGSHTLGRFRWSASTSYDLARRPLHGFPPADIAALIAEPAKTPEQTGKLISHYKSIAKELAGLRQQLADARKARDDYEGTIPRCLVSNSSDQPRTVRILPRGNFLVETGEIMQPGLPEFLVKPAAPGAKLTRVDLANWLVSRDNPLTARVFVNRLWKQFFGVGLSKVLDDLGSQGEAPQNQEVLDWLACEFMDSGWDIKHMIRLIVSSETYRQSSVPSKELQARDPYNREVASQSRWRLEAELVRDNALSVAGLLVNKVGGPSVKPYQPEGYWENLNFPQRTYENDKGESQYRRGLYTWWQRSFLHPSMTAFDAPSREECVAERNRSNIPQQALVLLNDPSYVEASRAFAARVLRECGGDAKARIRWAWREALARTPSTSEMETVEALLQKHLAEFRKDPDGAGQLLKTGLAPVPEGLDTAELAAWTNVARVILNLYETVTRS